MEDQKTATEDFTAGQRETMARLAEDDIGVTYGLLYMDKAGRPKIQEWSKRETGAVVRYGKIHDYDGSRYRFDGGLGLAKDGWRQYDTDQDAHYFGVWVHLGLRMTITYAEGDVSVTLCADDDQMRAELEGMEEFYGPAPRAFRVISNEGQVTDYYDDRPVA